jgi:lipoprotein-releasing system permease protein
MYKLTLIARYLIKRRITHFAIAAVALCVFIVVVVMTVMTGLVGELKQKNHDFVGDCVVGTKSLVGFPYYEEFLSILDRTEYVAGASPVVRNYAVIKPAGETRSRGVEIMGLDLSRHDKTTTFGRTLYYRLDDPSKAFEPIYDPNLPGCVLGIDLAMGRSSRGKYSVRSQPPRIAISITCFPLTDTGAPAASGTSSVASRLFYYSDNSQSGIPRIDGGTVYVPIDNAQALCMAGDLKRISSIFIKFAPGTTVAQGTAKIAELWSQFKRTQASKKGADLLDGVTVETWKEFRRAHIAPMEKEEAIMSVMFGLVGITTVFIVFVVFYMIVSHKTRDIGILRGVGASNWDVLGLFCGFGAVIGVIGNAAGILLGWLFLARINRIEGWLFDKFGWQLWDRSLYAIGDIPNQMRFDLVFVVACCALAACLIGAFLPACHASRLRPVETLNSRPLQ